MATGNLLSDLVGKTASQLARPGSAGGGQLMALGEFVFKLSTLAYSQFQRQNAWRHVKADRVGAKPAYQSLGPDEESFTFTGTMYAEFGNRKHFDTLREMADSGDAYTVVDAQGKVYGQYVIVDLSEQGTYFDDDGNPKKTEFSIKLIRVDTEPQINSNLAIARNIAG